jgi:hypothetical protein
MFQTCFCESFAYLFCFALESLYRPVSFTATPFTLIPLDPGDIYIGPTSPAESHPCACSTVGYSLISSCAGCQGDKWITYDSRCCFSSQLPELMYLPLVGQNTRLTAQGLCLPLRENLRAENLLDLALTSARRFPYPIPSGIFVPHWALLDVTVCSLSFFFDNVLTARSRLTMVQLGTSTLASTIRMTPVVGVFSRLFPPSYCLTPACCFYSQI